MPASIARLIATERISFCYATPTTFRAMMEHADLVATDQSTLRVVCFAGEVFPPKHLAALMRAWPEPAYYNLYGPTETNVCLFYRVPPDWNPAANDALPIGLPCSGDHAMLQGPNGIHGDGFVEGELLISGPSVMLGYWKRGGVDSAAFVQAKGCSWYPTGDFVKRRPDGCFVFQGRRDRLIKRRGFRIELGEIEAAVVRHDAISAAAAVAVSDHRGDTRIVVYFCSKGTVEPSWARLKRHCSRLLPLHMSPDLFRPLPAIPLTSTGKTDYPQLQEMALGLFDH